MSRWSRRGVALVATGVVAATAAGGTASHAAAGRSVAQHVLLISVDGLHQQDLAWYVSHHPGSTLAALAHGGVEFSHAQTPIVSDSFPGMVGQATGGDPGVTGVYYDDTWNHALDPAGTTDCRSVKPGVEVTYFEQLDRNPARLDAGQGLAGLPGSILHMTSNPNSLIDPAQLPVDPLTCQPVYPQNYLKVNTVFEVLRTAGMRTAWSDKHPAYTILNGPSGLGVQDLFTPEINSNAPNVGDPNDWTTDNALTMQYDSYKVRAVINEINGYDHSGTHYVGTPALLGMNFQTVSTAQKLPTSDGLTGGYEANGVTPGPLLKRALDYVDNKLEAFVSALRARGLAGSTTIILSAKHGQSPTVPSALTRIDDGAIISALDAAWAAHHPGAAPLVAFSVDDDAMLMWLNDRSQTAADFAKRFLLGYNGVGNDINGNPKPFTASGLRLVYAGAASAHIFKVQVGDPRVPDIFGVAQYGTVFTSKMAKIAEHGGANPQDRDVPLVVAGAAVLDRGIVATSVETTQIAPTILQLLGLNPRDLEAVRIEHTAVLPIG